MFEGENKYRMLGGNYTTCEVGNNDWFVRAKDFEIDKDRQIGTAHNASVEFLGVPILYSPYLSFSLDRQRKSGFLAPTFGTTGNSGAEFSIPYYWNIAPNRDATITPRVMSKRGIMLRNEFRYLETAYQRRNPLRSPAERPRQGRRQPLRVVGAPPPELGERLDGQRERAESLRQQLLYRPVDANRRDVAGDTAAPGRAVQNGHLVERRHVRFFRRRAALANAANRSTEPGHAAVQSKRVDLERREAESGARGFRLQQQHVAQFTHPTLINGTRAVAYPSVSVPLQSSFAYVTPKIGMHLTRYDFDQTNTHAGDQNRAVPILSTESGLVFERNMTLSGQGLLQTLEPKLYYVYIPTRNQNSASQF